MTSARDPAGSGAERSRLSRWVLAGGASIFAAAVAVPWALAGSLRVTPTVDSAAPESAPSDDPSPPKAPAGRPSTDGMVLVPAGNYRPFYKSDGAPFVPVAAFHLDRQPVRRREFLEFVREHPAWRRSAVKRLFAERAYLSDWPGELELGPGDAAAPQTFVSWFAARAYCKSRGKRLPALVEWERAAQRDGPGPSAVDPSAPFGFAMGRARDGAGGEQPIFGSVWEWTSDFNGSWVSGNAGPDGEAASALFCGAGARAVDAADYGAFLRYSFRSSLKADYTLKNLGFRCALDVE